MATAPKKQTFKFGRRLRMVLWTLLRLSPAQCLVTSPLRAGGTGSGCCTAPTRIPNARANTQCTLDECAILMVSWL